MKRIVIATLVAAAALAAVPAQAANVTVTLNVRLGRIEAPPAVSCVVSVPANANGVAVLSAARSSGCILSYSTSRYDCCGTFVLAIDEIRGTPEALSALFWAMTRNETCTDYGVDLYKAAQGDRLGFHYTTWLAGLATGEFC